MSDMSEYKFRVDTYAPGLKPRTNEEDEKKIKQLYSHLSSKLQGVEQELIELGVERIVIDVIKKGGLADDGED